MNEFSASLVMSSWLIFVEDPGAVNFFAPLLEWLNQKDQRYILTSAGEATRMLADRCHDSRPLTPDLNKLSGISQVIIGTSENNRSAGLALIDAARSVNVPSTVIIDSPINAEYRLRGTSTSALHHRPDWLLVPDELSRRAFSQLGFQDCRIKLIGNPHLSQLVQRGKTLRSQKEQLRAEILPEAGDKFVLTFVSEISDGLNASQYRKSPLYTLTGSDATVLRTHVVLDELFSALSALPGFSRDELYLVLRLHPKEKLEDVGPYANLFDHVSQGGAPSKLMCASDLITGMTTMLLVEAFYLGCQTLSIIPRESETNWLPTARDGLAPVVWERLQLRAQLQNFILEGDSVDPTVVPDLPDTVESITDHLLGLEAK